MSSVMDFPRSQMAHVRIMRMTDRSPYKDKTEEMEYLQYVKGGMKYWGTHVGRR